MSLWKTHVQPSGHFAPAQGSLPTHVPVLAPSSTSAQTSSALHNGLLEAVRLHPNEPPPAGITRGIPVSPAHPQITVMNIAAAAALFRCFMFVPRPAPDRGRSDE